MNESIKNEILDWNRKFPVDVWWRNKHNVAFNSKAHREISFLDQLFEYKEEKMYEDYRTSKKYAPNEGSWLIEQPKSKEQKEMSLVEEARKEMEGLPEMF